MEVYTLTISLPYSHEEEEIWSRTIEVPEEFTLRQLHQYIQIIIDFDDDHLYEFYAGRNPRNNDHVISKERRLNEIYPMSGFKLYYLFDFGDSWLFEIRKSRKKKILEGNSPLPTVVESYGDNPDQYPEYDE